ncbi:putative membrane protein [Alkalihalobacillus xiaoxiensis]|uniref:Membrane protein n=1 Tax=Shouchella xiaoxiensis TaxID=766895 RepID=A0ABS2T1W1_9BACI|nr:phage holin family protein [Shouchella xiaoxiensis]MBM7840462.1 putative membrane protein [Shouchella xiaoxiensis]
MRWLIGLLLNALVLWLLSELFSGFTLSGFGAAIIAALILSILNWTVKPLLTILTLPITIITLGLFLFVISALTLMLTAWLMGSSFIIDGFGIALLAAIIIALFQAILINPVKRS